MNNDICADAYNNYDFWCFDYLATPYMVAYEMPLDFAESNTHYIGDSRKGHDPPAQKNCWGKVAVQIGIVIFHVFSINFKLFFKLKLQKSCSFWELYPQTPN